MTIPGQSISTKIYWLETLSGELPETTVAPDLPRVPQSRSDYATVEFELDAANWRGLEQLKSGGDFSAFSILTTAVVAVLSKYVRSDELIIGVPPRIQDRRREPGVPGILPVRVHCGRSDRIETLLARVDEVTRHAFEHQEIDFRELLSLLGIKRSEDRCPIFDVALSLERYTHPLDLEAHPVDIAFAFKTPMAGSRYQVLYRTSLFETDKVERLATHFVNALTQLVTDQDRSVDQIEILTAEETERLVDGLNDNVVEFPLERTFHGLFEEQAAAAPDRTAAVFKEQSLTYATLNARANQLARGLCDAGIRKGDFVAILQHRNCNFLTAMLAVFKAGGAYVPVDPSYPPDRIRYMLADSQASHVVTEAGTYAELAEFLKDAPDLRFVFSQDGRVDSAALGERGSEVSVIGPEELARLPADNLNLGATGEDRAYMIYTSGSTGLPKGAICRHDGALNHLFGELHGLGIGEAFSFLQSAAASSDISVWQFLAPVLYGGATHIVDYDTVVDPQALFRVIRDNRIDLVELVPVVLRALVDYVSGLPASGRALPALRCMMATGDALPADVVNSWLELYPSIPVANTYGPTEASDDVTLYVTGHPLPSGQSIVPIGRPLPNLSIFILDPSLRLAPLGIPGEICVSGIGVGEGYWNKPEKTSAVFVPNPVTGARGDTIYRTGDLGRWLHDGSVQFLGRLDQQVKIRGFRIEPGEVEAVLLTHQAVNEVVVLARTNRAGNAVLVAYVVPGAGKPISTEELRDFLAGALPDYMVPSAFVTLGAMPLTPIGKIDRNALPGIEEIEHERSESFVEPRTATERTIAKIWADLLGLPEVGVDDDFVQLGGDSILGITVASRVQDAGFPIRPKHVFEYPTVAELAAVADSLAASKPVLIAVPRDAGSAEEATAAFPQPLVRLDPKRMAGLKECYPDLEDLYPLSPTQLGLYLHWALSAKGTGDYVEQIGLTLLGELEAEAFESAWRWVIAQTPSLRTCFTRRGLAVPLQVVVPDAPFGVRVLDWRERDRKRLESDLDDLSLEDRARGFDLSQPALQRVTLVRTEDAVYRMLWSYHHIVLDGWSELLVLGRVFRAYTALRDGNEPVAEPSPPYRDFIAWLERQDWAEAERYWRERLSDLKEPSHVAPNPRDVDERSPGISHAWLEQTLGRDETLALEDTARRWKLTLSTLLQGAWALLLCELTRSREVVFGTATSGRQVDVAGVHSIPGLFIATLPVRVHISDQTAVRSWLKLLQTQIVEMRQHEHYGLRRIQAVSDVPPDRLPLFDSIFVMANHPRGQLTDELGLDWNVAAVEYITMPHYPLTMFVVVGETLAVRLVYSRQHFGKEAISCWLNRYTALVDNICADPERHLGNLISGPVR